MKNSEEKQDTQRIHLSTYDSRHVVLVRIRRCFVFYRVVHLHAGLLVSQLTFPCLRCYDLKRGSTGVAKATFWGNRNPLLFFNTNFYTKHEIKSRNGEIDNEDRTKQSKLTEKEKKLYC